MVLRKDEFKQFVKFQSVNWFIKTHTDLCDGVFDDVWVNGCITKKRCSKCKSVAFVDTRTLNRGIVEGYIPRAKMGLEPVEYNQDRELFKFTNHCIDCGQWFRSTKKEDLCSSCSNTGNIDSGLDYDKFFTDSIEFWQGGQKHEVGSEGDRPLKTSFKKPKPSIQVMLLHIHGWLFEGLNQREMSRRLGEWWGADSNADTMYINSMLVRGQNTMPAGWSPA